MSRQRSRGFTLVELLVVIAIIGVLIALLLPAVQAAREAARRSHCSNNLRQLALAIHNYESTYGVIPPATVNTNQLAWTVLILPFIEQQPLHDKVDFVAGTWGSAASSPGVIPRNDLALNRISTFLCPSSGEVADEHCTYDPTRWTCHYFASLGPFGQNNFVSPPVAYNCDQSPITAGAAFGPSCTQGAFGGYTKVNVTMYPNANKLSAFADGTSTTFLLGELSWRGCQYRRAWFRGWHYSSTDGGSYILGRNARNPINSGIGIWNDVAFGSPHPGGCHFSMADASVRFVSENIDQAVYLATASRNGKEPVSVN